LIRGEHTNLRAVERTDATLIHGWFNSLDGPQGWAISDSTVSLAEVQRRIEGWIDEERSLGRPTCLVFEDLEGGLIGLIILSHYEPNHRALEIQLVNGIEFVKRDREVDALEALIETCFDQWNLHRLTVRAPIVSEQMTTLYERCGFRRDIVLREAAYFDGGYHDVALYCLLKTDRIPANEEMP
jgi:RimJ/RimL family protein N-acetyltransferase